MDHIGEPIGYKFLSYCSFWSKVNIWNVNFARATAFIYEIEDVSTWWGFEPPTPRVHAKYYNFII